MLQSLRIRNLALVEDLTWEVGPALVCVTGETGAGKSMIVGALKLVLGERADRSLIRTGEERCFASRTRRRSTSTSRLPASIDVTAGS